mgnify:CR=1 FL=1
MPFFNGQFLKCDILPVLNDPVLGESFGKAHLLKGPRRRYKYEA